MDLATIKYGYPESENIVCSPFHKTILEIIPDPGCDVIGILVSKESAMCIDLPVAVAVGVTVAVAVGVKMTQRPVVPLHDAPYTGTPLPRHCPLLGGPQAS